MSRTSSAARSRKNGCPVRISVKSCITLLLGTAILADRRRLALADRADFLGDVDPDGAPGDAAPAAHAARRAELVDPGREFVRHPLAVARLGGVPHVAAVDVREVHGEARVPPPPPLRVFAGEVGRVLDRAAEAGGAHHRAVRAGEAPGGDMVPARATVRSIASGASAGGPQCGTSRSTSAPRSVPVSTMNSWRPPSRISVRARSNPAAALGPVFIETQKHVPPAWPQFTAMMKACSRRARYVASTCGPCRKTRSWTAIACSSHARTPTNA